MIRKEGGQFSSKCSFLPSSYYFFSKGINALDSTQYFALSLYDNENDFYSLCTYERRTTYRSLSPSEETILCDRLLDPTLKASYRLKKVSP